MVSVNDSSKACMGKRHLSRSGRRDYLQKLTDKSVLRLKISFRNRTSRLKGVPSRRHSIRLLILLNRPHGTSTPLLARAFAVPQRVPAGSSLVDRRQVRGVARETLSTTKELTNDGTHVCLRVKSLIRYKKTNGTIVVDNSHVICTTVFGGCGVG